jgi:serine/threonine protein kinase
VRKVASPSPSSAGAAPFTREAGAEPLSGYRLIELLGSGGFGEVWKCEAPGGLHKAVKFVGGGPLASGEGGSLVEQELDALHRIRAIRHPFLLSIERVEVVAGALLVVMELADKSLQDVLAEYQGKGEAGIPRAELLGYLLEGAEVLDLMALQHGLQHLDVKPRNFFLVGNHLKVADFGLVRDLQDGGAAAGQEQAGLTPLYAAPEALQGRVSRHSDQYSLAIVYQELLTGTVPFHGRSARQLVLQHLTAEPDLNPLPAADREIVARALAKNPDERFASCLDFLRALQTQDRQPRTASREPPAGTANGMALVRGSVGVRFLERLEEGPLGETWKAQTLDGRPRLAHVLPLGLASQAEAADRLVARLRGVHHRALPQVEMVQDQTGRFVVLSELPRQTLRDRFQECVSRGGRGIPRDELLGYVGDAAEALDALARQHGLAHLGLTPRHLIVRDGRVQVGGFGLVPLMRALLGQAAPRLGGRYCAPELQEEAGGVASDQYSLAIIYAELLTGISPVSRRPGSRHGVSGPGVRLELDLLPATDREAVARALQPDPNQRHLSCADLVRALEGYEEAGGQSAEGEVVLPPVVPVGSLFGEQATPSLILPSVAELLATQLPGGAAGSEQTTPVGPQYVRCPGGPWSIAA